MRSDLRSAILVALVATGLAAGGCGLARTVHDDSAVDLYGSVDVELDFWDELAARRVVTNHDAIHALLLMAAGDDEAPPDGYEARLAEARRRGWVAGDRSLPENESATVGMVAVAVCDLIEVDGGLTMRLLGPSPRVCTKEIVYLGLIPRRTENQALSGLELIDLVTRIEAEHVDDEPEEAS